MKPYEWPLSKIRWRFRRRRNNGKTINCVFVIAYFTARLLCRLEIDNSCLIKINIIRGSLRLYLNRVRKVSARSLFGIFKNLTQVILNLCTGWKFHDFSVTQILRQINFEECRSSKTAIFAILVALNSINW